MENLDLQSGMASDSRLESMKWLEGLTLQPLSILTVSVVLGD